MKKFGEVIVNTSYKDFFSDSQKFRSAQYPTSSLTELEALDNNALTKALALLLQDCDSDRNALYGVEIKSNGSSRSGRIPLVRVAKNNPSIWKISSRVEDLQKTVTALDKLTYFLKKHNNQGYPMPLKVVVLRDDESYYATQNSPHYKFLRDLVEKSEAILFSLQFIKNLLANSNPADLNSYLQKTGVVFTTIPNN